MLGPRVCIQRLPKPGRPQDKTAAVDLVAQVNCRHE